jgi:hypothetical protein
LPRVIKKKEKETWSIFEEHLRRFSQKYRANDSQTVSHPEA